jgi:hypothetical protein
MVIYVMPASKKQKERRANPDEEQHPRDQKRAKGHGERQEKKSVRAKGSPSSTRRSEGISQSVVENRKAAALEEERLVESELSNVELKRMLDRALLRFGNWKVQMESNPSPKMVHSLKSIVSIIETITSISERNMGYSYKDLSLQMSSLIEGVAQLNLLITGSLVEDDSIDEIEETLINNQMMTVIQRTVELIRLVQQSFGIRNRLIDNAEESKD